MKVRLKNTFLGKESIDDIEVWHQVNGTFCPRCKSPRQHDQTDGKEDYYEGPVTVCMDCRSVYTFNLSGQELVEEF